MKAIVNTAAGRVQWQDWPMPEPGPGQVRIRTAACGVCATDLLMIAGWQRTGFPAIPGHEWSGTVDAVGSEADRALLGRRCVAENVLADGGEVGFEHAGGYGQYFLTEAKNVHPLPNEFPPTVAVLIEPLAVCVHALRRLRIENRSSALVFGDGPIGLLMLLLLKAEKVRQLALIGGRPARLALAGELTGCTVLNYHETGPELLEAAMALRGAPFPTLVEASGSATAMNLAVDLAPHCGKIVVMGDYGDGRAHFPWNQLLHREVELIGSNASAGAWPQAVELAVGGALPLARLVSCRLPAEAFAEALEMARSSRDVVKVVMEWPGGE
jgi:threonine dehydrogenase-like Zn-dependent dehydrogenase